MKNIFDELYNLVKEKGSCICVGLDPEYMKLPEELRYNEPEKSSNPLQSISEVILEFNKTVIAEIYDIIPAIKIQPSYYEKYGTCGISTMIETIKFAKKCGILVIEDTKISDLDESAENYAKSHLGKIEISSDINIPIFDSDFLTINPYLGIAGIKPFLKLAKEYNKGIFVIVKTSKAGSTDIQDLMIDTEGDVVLLFEVIAALIENENNKNIGDNGFGFIGASVDPTFEEYSASIKNIMSSSYFLVPNCCDARNKKDFINEIISFFREDGQGVIVNISSEIIYAFTNPKFNKNKSYAKSSRTAVLNVKKVINNLLKDEFGLDFNTLI